MTLKRHEGSATLHLQKDASDRLDRVKKVIDQTVDIGTSASYQLHSQGYQLHEAQHRLDRTEKNIQDAKLSTKELLKSLAFDRVMLFLFVLIILSGVVILVLHLTMEKKLA